MRSVLLVCASVSIAHARPGETSGQIKQRFGEPLTEIVHDKDAGKVVGKVSIREIDLPSPPRTSPRPTPPPPLVPGSTYIPRIRITTKPDPGRMRPVTKPPLTSSLRETSNVYQFGSFGIIVRYFDNQSQREEYRKDSPKQKLEQAEVDQILTAASNGALWAAETPGSWKSKGLRAWLTGKTLIVETDAFRELQLSKPVSKPEAGKLGPRQGKGF